MFQVSFDSTYIHRVSLLFVLVAVLVVLVYDYIITLSEEVCIILQAFTAVYHILTSPGLQIDYVWGFVVILSCLVYTTTIFGWIRLSRARRSLVKVLYYFARYWGLAHVMWVAHTSVWRLMSVADTVGATRFTTTGMIYPVDTSYRHNISCSVGVVIDPPLKVHSAYQLPAFQC